MNHLTDDHIKNLIKRISRIGIAVMAVLALLAIPVEYQVYAFLYANQNLEKPIQLAVAGLIVTASGLLLYLNMRKQNETRNGGTPHGHRKRSGLPRRKPQ